MPGVNYRPGMKSTINGYNISVVDWWTGLLSSGFFSFYLIFGQLVVSMLVLCS